MATVTKSSLKASAATGYVEAAPVNTSATLLTVPAGKYAIFTLCASVTDSSPANNFCIDVYNTSGTATLWAVWWNTAGLMWKCTSDNSGLEEVDMCTQANLVFPLFNSGPMYAGPGVTITVRTNGNFGGRVTMNYTLFENT